MKISSASSVEISNQVQDERNLVSIEEEYKVCTDDTSIKRMHWANRDFSEYKKAA